MAQSKNNASSNIVYECLKKDILNLKIEDLKEITNDKDIQNIIILREYIKNHNTIEYFNYTQTKKEEEET